MMDPLLPLVVLMWVLIAVFGGVCTWVFWGGREE